MNEEIINEYLKGLRPKYYSQKTVKIDWKKFINKQLKILRTQKTP